MFAHALLATIVFGGIGIPVGAVLQNDGNPFSGVQVKLYIPSPSSAPRPQIPMPSGVWRPYLSTSSLPCKLCLLRLQGRCGMLSELAGQRKGLLFFVL